MKKENVLTCIIIFLLIIIFIIFVFAQQSNKTNILYNSDENATSDSNFHKKGSKTSKSSKGSKSAKNKKSNKDKKDVIDKDKNNDNHNNNIDNNSNKIQFEEDMFSDNTDDNTNDIIVDSNNDNQENTNSSESGSQNNNTPPENNQPTQNDNSIDTDAKYKDILNRANSLNRYGIQVHINWYKNIVDANYDVIKNIDVADKMISFVENIVDSLPNNYFNNLKQRGYNNRFILVGGNSSNYIDYNINPNDITYIIRDNQNMYIKDFFAINYETNVSVIGKNKMNVLYYEIARINPSEFKYGEFNREYITNNYFLDTNSQRSVNDDAKSIFVQYYSNQLDVKSYVNTPVYNKIRLVVDLFDREVFY